MPALATAPTATILARPDTDALARAAVADLVAFWAGLPVDPIDLRQARAELLGALPSLRRLAEAVGG